MTLLVDTKEDLATIRKRKTDELKELQLKSKEFNKIHNITRNRLRSCYGTLQTHIRQERERMTDEIIKLEREIREINSIKKDVLISREEIFFEIMKECMPENEPYKIAHEANRRINGEEKKKIVLDVYAGLKDSAVIIKDKNNIISGLRKELSSLHSLLLKARRSINQYITESEPEINKADFIRKVSALNKCIPTLTEIEKIKRNLNF